MNADVLEAVASGAVPSDLLDGFDAFRAAVLARKEGRAAMEKLRREATDPFDTHPSLADRLAALEETSHEAPSRPDDDAPALALLEIDVHAWLAEETARIYRRPLGAAPLKRIRWSEIPAQAFEPLARENANRAARTLVAMFPSAQTLPAMFAAIVQALEAGALPQVACCLNPAVARVPIHQQWAVARRVVATAVVALFQGALLERGARAQVSFGEPCMVWRFGDVDVRAAVLAARSFESASERVAIGQWATHLAA